MSLLLTDPASRAAMIKQETPEPIHVRRWTRNGITPDVALYNLQANALNHIAAYGGREVFCYAAPNIDVDIALGSNGLRYKFTTGPGTRHIYVNYILSKDYNGSGDNPRVRFTFEPLGGTTGAITSTFTTAYGRWDGAMPATYDYHPPDGMLTRGRLVSVYPNQDYQVTIETIDGGQLVCAIGVERAMYWRGIVDADYQQHSLANPQDEAGWPYALGRSAGDVIHDYDRSRLARASADLWDHGATIVAYDGGGSNYVSDGKSNMLNNLGVQQGGFGWDCSRIDQYRARYTTGLIKLRLRVLAEEFPVSGGGSISIISERGGLTTPLISVTGIAGSTATWYETTQYEHGGTLAAGGWGVIYPVGTASGGAVRIVTLILEMEGS